MKILEYIAFMVMSNHFHFIVENVGPDTKVCPYGGPNNGFDDISLHGDNRSPHDTTASHGILGEHLIFWANT
jgi:hypothetical protein